MSARSQLCSAEKLVGDIRKLLKNAGVSDTKREKIMDLVYAELLQQGSSEESLGCESESTAHDDYTGDSFLEITSSHGSGESCCPSAESDESVMSDSYTSYDS